MTNIREKRKQKKNRSEYYRIRIAFRKFKFKRIIRMMKRSGKRGNPDICSTEHFTIWTFDILEHSAVFFRDRIVKWFAVIFTNTKWFSVFQHHWFSFPLLKLLFIPLVRTNKMMEYVLGITKKIPCPFRYFVAKFIKL